MLNKSSRYSDKIFDMMVFNTRGNMLLSALIGVGILTSSILVIATAMDHFRLDQKSMSQKFEIMQLQQYAAEYLASPTLCACQFDASKFFDTTNLTTTSVDIGTLYSACNAGVPANPLAQSGQALPGTQSNLRVASVRLNNFESLGGTTYRARLEIAMDPSSLVMGRRPASIPITLQADTSAPAAAKVTACSFGSTGNAGAGTGTMPASLGCASAPPPNSYLGALPEAPAGTAVVPAGGGSWQAFMGPAACDTFGYRCDVDTSNPITFKWKLLTSPPCFPSSG